jgi:hypothetical protein
VNVWVGRIVGGIENYNDQVVTVILSDEELTALAAGERVTGQYPSDHIRVAVSVQEQEEA